MFDFQAVKDMTIAIVRGYLIPGMILQALFWIPFIVMIRDYRRQVREARRWRYRLDHPGSTNPAQPIRPYRPPEL